MSIELTLHQTNASGPLLPSRITAAFAQLERVPGRAYAPKGAMRGQELRLALTLSLSDEACPAFMLDIGGQGKRARGRAHGPSAVLLAWALHALAGWLKCRLYDVAVGRDLAPDPEAHRAAAVAYLSVCESEVRADRGGGGESRGAAFLAWLVREEHVALAGDASALGAALPMEDAPALYELLLESDAVEDVFVSETELTALLARFRARSRR